MIVLLHARDPAFVREASRRGVFAHISDADVEDWQSSIDIVLRRFAEYHDLKGAFGRRALTERAKGILTERHPGSRSLALGPDSRAGRLVVGRRTATLRLGVGDAIAASARRWRSPR